MAQAIPKREWLQVEEDLCRTALLEYLMEHWEQPMPGGYASPRAQFVQPGQNQAQRAMAVQALEEFGWLEEASDQVDTKIPRTDAEKGV
jgi:hypothetical protein